MKIENGTMKTKIFASFISLALAFAFASCDSLQDSLSSEQLKDQKEGIGSLSADSAVYYFNGTEADDISGSEAHLVLNLSQIANADTASVKYNLAYTMGSEDDKKDYTTSGSVNGTLSDSKSKYYVDLSPAINLIDGEKNPAYGDISLTLTVSGLTNASGNDYDGRAIPTFTQSVKFAPLYNAALDDVPTNSFEAGSTFKIPLNCEIEAIDEEVSAEATVGTLPETTFTASLSDDKKSIVVKTSADITGEEFTASLTFSGIKVAGVKETYTHTFKGIVFALELPSKEFKGSDLDKTPKRVINADDVKDLDIQKISFSWEGSPSWITAITTAGDASDDWGDVAAATKLEEIKAANKTVYASKSDWCKTFVDNIKENGLKIACEGISSITITVYYNE